jgi:hypothetical protein
MATCDDVSAIGTKRERYFHSFQTICTSSPNRGKSISKFVVRVLSFSHRLTGSVFLRRARSITKTLSVITGQSSITSAQAFEVIKMMQQPMRQVLLMTFPSSECPLHNRILPHRSSEITSRPSTGSEIVENQASHGARTTFRRSICCHLPRIPLCSRPTATTTPAKAPTMLRRVPIKVFWYS